MTRRTAHARRAPVRTQRGVVTAEMAVGMLAGAILLVMVCWGLGVGVTQLRAMDAAAQVARAEARGDHERAAELVREAPGAHVSASRLAGRVQVTVSLPVAGWGPLRTQPVEATATADLEPGE